MPFTIHVEASFLCAFAVLAVIGLIRKLRLRLSKEYSVAFASVYPFSSHDDAIIVRVLMYRRNNGIHEHSFWIFSGDLGVKHFDGDKYVTMGDTYPTAGAAISHITKSLYGDDVRIIGIVDPHGLANRINIVELP